MKTLLMLAAVASGFLFTGCETMVVDRHRGGNYRSGYADRGSSYHSRPVVYGRTTTYRQTRSAYPYGYSERSRPVRYSSGYSRRDSNYYSDSRRTSRDVTYPGRTTVNRRVATDSGRTYSTTKTKKNREWKDRD